MVVLTLADAIEWLSEHQGCVRYERGGVVVVTARHELTMLDATARVAHHHGSATEATIAAVLDLKARVAARRARMAGGAR